MREIEFKARTIDDGSWGYDSYTCMEEEDDFLGYIEVIGNIHDKIK